MGELEIAVERRLLVLASAHHQLSPHTRTHTALHCTLNNHTTPSSGAGAVVSTHQESTLLSDHPSQPLCEIKAVHYNHSQSHRPSHNSTPVPLPIINLTLHFTPFPLSGLVAAVLF